MIICIMLRWDLVSDCQTWFVPLGSYSVQDVTPTKEGESSKVKVKVRLDIHGLFTVVNASMVEKMGTATDTEQDKMEVEGQEDKATEAEAAAEVSCYLCYK